MLAEVDLNAAIKASQRMRIEVERTNFDCGVNGARVAVTFSMGLAIVSENDTSESLLKKADTALYQSKNRGRNQLNWHTDEPSDDVVPNAARVTTADQTT